MANQEKLPYDPHIMRMLQDEGGHDDDSISELNVIPFIDITLVLLIIVLISSAFQFQLFVFANPSSDTFEVVNVSKDATNVITLEIISAKEIVLNKQPTTISSLGGQVKSLWNSGKYIALVISAPNDLTSQEFIDITEVIKDQSPATKFSFITTSPIK
ncbi:MAG: hypothetical protein COA79_14815 [Planctomycetota bacterium]|nr:MAG: hypothetical protein COA79_14815 [Planctomycetota bacterium]